MLATGNRFVIQRAGDKKEYSLAVFSLSGKRIVEKTVSKETVDIRKDLGILEGVYIIRLRAVLQEK